MSTSSIHTDSRIEQRKSRASVRVLREANEELVLAALRSQNQAEAVQQQITCVAMVAHELRAPLLPLRLAVELFSRARDDDQLFAQVQTTLTSQIGQLNRLVGDLLDGSCLSIGKFRLQCVAVELADILKMAIETCQPAMQARRHHFTSELPPASLKVKGDAARLVQVFSNLLDNAIKYSPAGSEISLKVRAGEASVSIHVADNGIGISAHALPYIFELFVRDACAAAHSQGGLGIGLAIVRDLVAAHGGKVEARSAGEDLGSEFIVTLPLAASN